MRRQSVLVLGGARSGKSQFAERLASKLTLPVVYIATGRASDEEMGERIEKHRARRPAEWVTVEAERDLARRARVATDGSATLLIDSITLLVSTIAFPREVEDGHPRHGSFVAICVEHEALFAYAAERACSMVLVSDEVGLGIVPERASGRAFRDLLGETNQWLAARCDAVYLMVAGLAIDLKRASTP